MAKIKFHGTLRDHIPQGEVFLDGNRSVAQVLKVISNEHPKLKEALYTEEDELQEYIVVVVNEEQVEFLDAGMDTRLVDEDVVQVFPPVSGG